MDAKGEIVHENDDLLISRPRSARERQAITVQDVTPNLGGGTGHDPRDIMTGCASGIGEVARGGHGEVHVPRDQREIGTPGTKAGGRSTSVESSAIAPHRSSVARTQPAP